MGKSDNRDEQLSNLMQHRRRNRRIAASRCATRRGVGIEPGTLVALGFWEGMELRTLLFIFVVFFDVLEAGQFTCVRALQFWCHPSFVEVAVTVRSAWKLCLSQFWEHSLGLVGPCVTYTLKFWRTLPVLTLHTVAGRTMCHLCSAVLTYFVRFLQRDGA